MKYKSSNALNKPRGWIYGAKWAQIPCEARVVKVIVGTSPAEWWCSAFVGTERTAIEVKLDGRTVFVDNEDGKALEAILRGLAPWPGFRFLPVFKVVPDKDIPVFYKARAS